MITAKISSYLFIFSSKIKKIRRGKWKCPLYFGPTDTNITVDQIRDLEPIQNAWIYLRVSFPDDELFGKMKSLYPENAMVITNLFHNTLVLLFPRENM